MGESDTFAPVLTVLSARRSPSAGAAFAALASVTLFYAVGFFVLKQLFREMSPFALLALRGITGVAFFGLLALIQGFKLPARGDIWRFAACGFSGIALNQLFFLWGMSKTHEVNGAVIMITTPVFVFLIAWLLRQERLDGRKLLGLALSFAGALLLSLGGRALRFHPETSVGDLMIMVNAISYAAYLVLLKPLSQRYDNITLSFWIFFCGGLLSIPTGLPAMLQTDWAALSTGAWWNILYVLLFVTILAYSLNSWAMQRVQSSQVGVFIYLQPVLVALISPWVYAGSLNVEKTLYILLTMAGVALVTFRKKT